MLGSGSQGHRRSSENRDQESQLTFAGHIKSEVSRVWPKA